MADRKQSDFGNIQREVMNRARQMQQNDRQEKEKVEKNNQKIESKSNVKKQENLQQDNNENTKHTDLMDIIMADKERSLIILLIILLTEEKADSSLILALMYLII